MAESEWYSTKGDPGASTAEKSLKKSTTGLSKLIPNLRGTLDFSDTINARGNSPYDEATDRLIGQQYHLASQGDDHIASQMMQNVGASENLLGSPEESQRYNQSLGMLPNPALSAAIQNQAQQGYRNDLARMEQEAKLRAPLVRASRQRSAFDALQMRQGAMDKAQERRVALALQERQARASTISSLFGGAGAIVGGIFGGPGGAQAGYQAGSATGGMAAGGV